MLNNNNLTQEQQRIYGILEHTIQDGKDISSILKSASREDILQVLTTAKIPHFEDHATYTLTPLGFALSLPNKSEEVNAILTKAQDDDILEEILATKSITWKIRNLPCYTLTPLSFAINLGMKKYIEMIKQKMEENKTLSSFLLQDDQHQSYEIEYDSEAFKSFVTPSDFRKSKVLGDNYDQKTPTSLDKLSEHKGKVVFGAIVFCIANTIAAALITPWLAITAAVAAIVAISVFVKEIHSEYKQQDADEKSVLKATGTVLSDMIPGNRSRR